MSTSVEVVAQAGSGFLEGPVWRPATRDLLVTSVTGGLIVHVDVESGAAETFADTGGGPNGARLCADGGLVVTQNGGLDWAAAGFDVAEVGSPTVPGLQRVHPDGSVVSLTAEDGPFQAPNDLFVTADGTIWFTDPPPFPAPPQSRGRVWRWSPGARPQVVADGFVYCNGIGVESDGTVVVVETLGGVGLRRLGRDGSERSWLIERLPHNGDGFAFDVEGNLSVAGGQAVTVVSPGGEVLEILRAPEDTRFCTNVCFGGDDLRTLFVTDGNGRVLAFQDRPVAGRPLHPASV